MLRLSFVLMLCGIGVYVSLQGGAFYGLLFYFWYAYFSPQEWVWGDVVLNMKLSFFIGIYVVLVSLFSRRRFGERYIVNGQIAVLFVFALYTWVTAMLSEYYDVSMGTWKGMVPVFLITYMIPVLVINAAKYRLAIITIALSLGLLAAKQGWYHILFVPGKTKTGGLSFVQEGNGLAVTLLMLVPMLIALYQTAQSKKAKWLYLWTALGTLFLSILTHSRGAFLTVAVLALLYCVRSRYKLQSLIGIGVLGGCLLVMLPGSYWERMNTILGEQQDRHSAGAARLHTWAVARDMHASAPWLGLGFNAYQAAYNDFDFSHGTFNRDRAVHSIWFGILAELGYIGMALYLLLIFMSLWNCWQIRRYANREPELWEIGRYALAIEATIVAWMVGGTFLTFQYHELIWHHFGLAIALREIMLSLPARSESRIPPTRAVQRYPGVSV